MVVASCWGTLRHASLQLKAYGISENTESGDQLNPMPSVNAAKVSQTGSLCRRLSLSLFFAQTSLRRTHSIRLKMFGFIWRHFFSDFQAPDVDLTGKTAIVTGSNVGTLHPYQVEPP